MQTVALERTLSELDHLRLVNLLLRGRHGDAPAAAAPLEHVLDHCDIVAPREVPPDLVTMQSRLLLRDLDTGSRHELTLCYPADANPGTGSVSVLSPMGSSLLGLRAGGVARWTTPTGTHKQAEIVAILFQPEDSGDYAM